MIFGKEYDTSLWYIVKADRKKRQDIINLINEIPEELLDEIRKTVNKDESHFNIRVSEKDPSVYYHFQVDSDDSLAITKSFVNGENFDTLIELRLIPFRPEFAIKIGICDMSLIGYLSNNIRTTHFDQKFGLVEEDESEYFVLDTPIGHFAVFNREIFKGRGNIPLCKPVSKKVPEDINRENIICKKLVLNKKK